MKQSRVENLVTLSLLKDLKGYFHEETVPNKHTGGGDAFGLKYVPLASLKFF
jgi:hypothetical protein